MASRDAEARTPLLHGEGRDDARSSRAAQKSRVALLAGVGAVAGLALVGHVRAPFALSSLGIDDGSGRPTLYAMLDQAPLADQLKHLQCYRKMAEDAGMQLAVGEYTSDHFEETVRLDDLVANEGQGWRSMTKGDWQRIEDAGGPDLCITARDEHGEDGAAYAYPGGTIVSAKDSVITSYEDVIHELKTREWWTCLGSQTFDVCTAKDAQVDFRPSPHVTEVIKIAQKSLFGKDNDKGFRAAHMSREHKNSKEKNAGDAYKAFRDACKEAKAGMGPPVYVATGPMSKASKTHAKLHEMGCVTYQNITGYDMLQDWELAAMDQFMLAEAETHVTTACSAADSIAAQSRRMRAAAKSEVYVAESDAFLDVPEDGDERACAKAVDAMARSADATKSADEAFEDKVQDAARGGGEDGRRGSRRGRRRGGAADADAGGKAEAKEEAEKRTEGAGEDAGEARRRATRPPPRRRASGPRASGPRLTPSSSRGRGGTRVRGGEGRLRPEGGHEDHVYAVQHPGAAQGEPGRGGERSGGRGEDGGGVDPGLGGAHHRGRQGCARGCGRGEDGFGRQEEGGREGEREGESGAESGAEFGVQVEARRGGGGRRGGRRDGREGAADRVKAGGEESR